MDILYTLKECKTCDELTYSMRSLANLPHDRVFIVGGCPDNINKDKVVYIPSEQKGTKWKNSRENVKLACKEERLSDDFIFMNDDFFIMKDVQDPVKELNLSGGTMQHIYEKYQGINANVSNWCKGLQETRQLLIKQGFSDPLSYDLHTPFIFNKQEFLKMFEIQGIEDIDVLHWRSVYGNLHLKDTQFIEDVKVRMCDTIPQDSKFLSCSDSGFAVLKPILEKLFANKSEYEV